MSKDRKSLFDDVILWIGKPLFKPYLMNHILGFKSSLEILLIGSCVSLFGSLWGKEKYNWDGLLSYIAFLCIVAFLQIIYKIIAYRNTRYWITKDAVYIQTGAIITTITSIQKNEIRFIDITKNSAEIKHMAGTVVIDDGEKKEGDVHEYNVYKKLIAVKNPEEVIRFL